MFRFFIGNLNLQHKNVQTAGKYCAGPVSEYWARYDPKFFDRFLHQVMYFYDRPQVIRNPITALFCNGYLQSVHPGTSRLLGPYLAQAETVPCLGVLNRDLNLQKTLDEYFTNYEETEDYFYTRDLPSPNSFHYSKENSKINELDWLEQEPEPVRDVVYKMIWSKHPNIKWIDNDGDIYTHMSDWDKEVLTIKLAKFEDIWQSLINISKE